MSHSHRCQLDETDYHMVHSGHCERSRLIVAVSWQAVSPLTFPQFSHFPCLRSHSSSCRMFLFSPLHSSLPLLMLPVIYSVHLQTTAGLFSEHYSLFLLSAEKPQQGESIGSMVTQQPSCQHILKCTQSAHRQTHTHTHTHTHTYIQIQKQRRC